MVPSCQSGMAFSEPFPLFHLALPSSQNNNLFNCFSFLLFAWFSWAGKRNENSVLE
jgi:hypothetical protein